MVWGPATVVFYNDAATTEIYTLSLHDALPIWVQLAKALLARSSVKLTVPLGALAEVGVLSVTVAVQLLGLPTGTIAGMQLTSVLVSCLSAVTTKAPELPRWLASPP